MSPVGWPRRLLGLVVLVVVVVLACSAFTRPVCAHALDEYVQSALVDVDPSGIRLRINLTPGKEIADEVLAVIDADGDGAISEQEGSAYLEALKRDLTVRLDGREVRLENVSAKFPEPAEMRTGWGIIQLEFALPYAVEAGTHTVAFENRHFPKFGEYLFNAALPNSESVKILKQTRNKNQSTGEVEFAYDGCAGFPVVIVGVIAGVAVLVVAAGLVWKRWGVRER